VLNPNPDIALSPESSLDSLTANHPLPLPAELHQCPHSRGSVVNLDTGQVLPASCQRVSCLWCGARLAQLVAGALQLVQPSVMVTITWVGEDWPEAHTHVNRVHDYLARGDESVSWGWVVERDDNDRGQHHVHAWAHDPISRSTLESSCKRAGVGSVHVSSSTPGPRTAPIRYAFKFLRYVQGSGESQRGLIAHLAANGRRLFHNSRRFWRHGSRPLRGIKDAIANYREWVGASRAWRWVPDDGSTQGRRAS
jgi:hypothetical protein